MRMTPTRSPRLANPASDRGVASALIALLIAAFLGLSALVIDVGSAWEERRELVTATDAAALAAVQDYVAGSTGDCDLVAADYLSRNNPESALVDCVHTGPTSSRPGRVTVTASSRVEFTFAPIVGVNEHIVTSSTTTSYDEASIISGGLRPFGLCIHGLAALTPAIDPGNGVHYRIYYGKDSQPNDCGHDAPGNWGTLDFNGGSNPQTEIRDWTENGYDGPVEIGEWYEGNPGAYTNDLRDEMNFLLTVDHFTLPIFDTVVDNGANTEFLIDNFAVVRLHDFKLTGPEADRYLTIEFLDEVVQGTGGGPSDTLGAYVIGICSVDGLDATATCQ